MKVVLVLALAVILVTVSTESKVGLLINIIIIFQLTNGTLRIERKAQTVYLSDARAITSNINLSGNFSQEKMPVVAF